MPLVWLQPATRRPRPRHRGARASSASRNRRPLLATTSTERTGLLRLTSSGTCCTRVSPAPLLAPPQTLMRGRRGRRHFKRGAQPRRLSSQHVTGRTLLSKRPALFRLLLRQLLNRTFNSRTSNATTTASKPSYVLHARWFATSAHRYKGAYLFTFFYHDARSDSLTSDDSCPARAGSTPGHVRI